MESKSISDSTQSVSEFKAQRLQLEGESLAGEVLAESYGQFMETIWDEFNISENKLPVFRSLQFDSIEIGEWSEPVQVEHGISIRKLHPNAPSWALSKWRSWLDQMSTMGIQMEQMQWRHVGFDISDISEPVSDFLFDFNAKRDSPETRWILRGRMRVFWIPSASASSFPEIRTVKVTDATMLERTGLPPFEHVVAADVSPSDQDVVLEPNLQVLDLDQDSAPEIILSRINRVFWNQGSGRFRTGALLEFPVDHFHQGIVADFNEDAYRDFLAVSADGLAFYGGDGKGAFAQAPQIQTLFGSKLVNPFVLTAGDIDGDGDLDVWLGQYKVPYQEGQMPTPYFDANDGHPAYLLRNIGDGVFEDATDGSGLGAKRFRRTYSASLVDLDDDLDLDLVVVSDFSGVDVYRNDGTGEFEDVTEEWLGDRHGFGMAHLIGDWNLDGRLDLLMIGMHSPAADRMESLGIELPANAYPIAMRRSMSFGNRVFWGEGPGFRQEQEIHPMQRTGWSWGAANIDFDLDGDEDVYIVNGHITGARTYDYESEFWREDLYIGDSDDDPGLRDYIESKQLRYRQAGASYGGHERNKFFLNIEGREWIEVAYLFGLALPEDCRNVVAGDFDGNGLPDLALTTFELWPDERQMLHLFPNFLQTKNHWIGFELRESKNWPPLMGSKLQIKTNHKTFTHPVITGDGYRTQSPYRVHLGLGQADHIGEMILKWPDGTRHTFTPDKVDRYYIVESSEQ